MSQALFQRVIAITGAFGNLGDTLAGMAAAQGAHLVLIDRASTTLPSTPGLLVQPRIDLTSVADCQAVAERVEAHFGRLDALVNVAGGFAWEPIQEGTVDTWDHLYSLNLRTAVNTCQAFLPLIRRSSYGRIINVGASAAAKAGLGMGAYAASKAGVLRLTESLAEELKDQNVTVNAVLPSIIDTRQNRESMPDADFNRWVTPSQLSEVILFLLSDAASAITGASIPVNGKV